MSSSNITRKVQELAATVPQQRKGMEVLTAQLQEQPAQIQKVSAQLEMSKPAAKVVVNQSLDVVYHNDGIMFCS